MALFATVAGEIAVFPILRAELGLLNVHMMCFIMGRSNHCLSIIDPMEYYLIVNTNSLNDDHDHIIYTARYNIPCIPSQSTCIPSSRPLLSQSLNKGYGYGILSIVILEVIILILIDTTTINVLSS